MKNKTKIVLITWNDAQGSTISGEDKKRSQSKKYRRIGIHLIINEEELDINNSPSLKQCEGCTKNISKKKETKECLIYLEGEFSKTIEKRSVKATKSAVNKEEKRTYNYNVIWIINEIENYFLANEIIIDYNDQGYKKVIEIKKKARGMLKDKNIVMTIVHKIEIIEEALLVNEYNLIWNKKIVMGGFRKWSKKVTDAIWKNEILNSEKLDDLFMYNFRKNLTGKQLWNLSAIQLEDKNLQDEIKILRNYNFDFMKILEQLQFEEKFVIKNLWNFVYEEFRQRIWIPRCDEIKEIERKEDIQKMDLRKRKDRDELELDRKKKKYKKQKKN
ncbi:hypothetical protein RhiirA5_415501 [Rhizophagus irregularis]|uniref:Uncharacterized protein n=1 Tax=Rhizophagus irregularis TaxID=588596 RepID=A0A2N0PRV0_9GLOM|nr:hypothetical protein RhiirA5_415501 [Rhizophagus irregularis]